MIKRDKQDNSKLVQSIINLTFTSSRRHTPPAPLKRGVRTDQFKNPSPFWGETALLQAEDLGWGKWIITSPPSPLQSGEGSRET
jgi:hypothetical protein